MPADMKAKPSPEMSSCMQYAKEGSTFEFEVYFDRISIEQLKQLYTALTFGDTSNGPLCHKIGHGKPIGFGSVKIIVTEAVIRSFTDSDGYITDGSFLEQIKPVALPPDVRKAVDYNSVKGLKIDYPKDDKGNIYGWFSKNRPPADKEKARFYSKLPMTSCDEQELNENPKNGQLDRQNQHNQRSQSGQSKQSGQQNETFVSKQTATMNSFAKGKCRSCSNQTKINPKTGKHYEYCNEHKNMVKKPKL